MQAWLVGGAQGVSALLWALNPGSALCQEFEVVVLAVPLMLKITAQAKYLWMYKMYSIIEIFKIN